MTDKFSLDCHASCYLCDINRHLRPSAFLDFAQDAATRAAFEEQFGDDNLRPYNGVWIVARMQTQFLRPIHFREDLRIETWHKGLKGINFIRDYRLVDSMGQSVINATSSWVIMNMSTRTVMREPSILERIPTSSDTDYAIEQPCPKIVLPKSAKLKHICSHLVSWSEVDYNGHANNVKYSVWAIDALDQDYVRSHFLSELSINFNKEVPPGSVVELYHYSISEADCDIHYIEGRVSEHQAFISRLIWK